MDLFNQRDNIITLVKIQLEDVPKDRPEYHFMQRHDHKPRAVSMGAVDIAVEMETYRATVETFCRDRRRVSLALDKPAQELVDLYVEAKTSDLQDKLGKAWTARNRVQRELEATWCFKIKKVLNKWLNI